MYWLICMLLAHGASARTAGHSARPNGLGPAALGGAGNGGGSEGGVLLLPEPVFSPLSSLLPRSRRRIAYYEPPADAPAISVQPSPAPERLKGNAAGEDAGDDGSPRSPPGVGADSDARLPPGGVTSSPLPDVTTVHGGGGNHPGNVDGGGGGGAHGGQAPVPTLPGFGTGDGGSHGHASEDAQPPGAAGDALPPGDDAGSTALEGSGSSANVLVS